MGNGIVREMPNLNDFKQWSSEYDKLRLAGLTAEEIHAIISTRVSKTQSIASTETEDFSRLKEDAPRGAETTTAASSSNGKNSKPVQSEPVPSVSKPAPAPKPAIAKPVGLALLIDDSPVAAKVASKVLKAANFDVVTANSAKMGFDILLGRKDDIALIFLDVVMPNVDGVECLSWIKDNPDVAHIPVYMLSGLEDQMLTEVCLERGAEGMLLKPLSIDTVKTIMRSHGLGTTESTEIAAAVTAASVAASPRVSFSRPPPIQVQRSMVNMDATSSPPTKSVATSSSSATPAQAKRASTMMTPPATATVNIGSIVPAFKLVDSDFEDFLFPPASSKKHTLLLFIPTVFCAALYEETGFMMRFFNNYDVLMNSKKFQVYCLSADTPFALAAAKKRFKIPFPLVSDVSLFISQKFVGTMDIGSQMAYAELQQRSEISADHSQDLVYAQHSQQSFQAPKIGMVLLNRKREVLNKWVATLPTYQPSTDSDASGGSSAIHPKEVNLAQFPSNFKEWVQTIGVDDSGGDSSRASTTPYQQSSNNNNRREPGSGIATGAGESKERDQGSTPVATAMISKSSKTPISSSSVSNGNGTVQEKQAILVIDDSSVSSRVVCKKLEQMGFLVHAAYDGLKGYDMLRRKSANYAIVLCDVVMPNCDGMGFLKLIKADQDFQHIPVVMLSGLEGEELSKNCLDLGANSLLKKPFDDQRFAEILQELNISAT